MATPTRTSRPAWQAEIEWRSRRVPLVADAPAPDEGAGLRCKAAVAEAAPDDRPEVTFVRVRECFVVASRAGFPPIRFRVNHRDRRFPSVTDPRERLSGTAGATGIWGTRPAPRANRPRPLTLTEFRRELAPLVGPERAEEVVGTVRANFLVASYYKCRRVSEGGPAGLCRRRVSPVASRRRDPGHRNA
jgi:hypothetical protein